MSHLAEGPRDNVDRRKHNGEGSNSNGVRATGHPTAPATGVSVQTTELSDKLIPTFYADKVFGPPIVGDSHRVTSFSFDDRGEMLISAGTDEQIQLFSLSSGRHKKTQQSKKYGINLIRFTHSSGSVIHTSTKIDHHIRYHSVQKNTYLRYFEGHQSHVSALRMSPVNDTFLSAAVNESVRMWDLRSKDAQNCLAINGHACLAYDPSGQVSAIAFAERREVLLYDVRRWTQRPFSTFLVDGDATAAPITSLTFSPTGAMILVGTPGEAHYIIDAFDGRCIYRLCGKRPSHGHADATASGHECGWTPDAKFVYSGTGDRSIYFWSIPEPTQKSRDGDASLAMQDLQPFTQVTSNTGRSTNIVAFNPRSAMMVSAGDRLAFWLPKIPRDT